MIHRADALPRCLAALAGRFGGIAVRPVHAKPEEPAIRILVSAVKGSRAPFSLAPPLVLHGPDGRFTPRGRRPPPLREPAPKRALLLHRTLR